MKRKSLIEKQLQRKSNSELIKTIILTKKSKAWMGVAETLSSPRRKIKGVNLDKINKESKDNEIAVIPGKVLSQGEINKKIKVVALNFSEKTKEKLDKAKIEYSDIESEIKKNPEGKGIKILK